MEIRMITTHFDRDIHRPSQPPFGRPTFIAVQSRMKSRNTVSAISGTS